MAVAFERWVEHGAPGVPLPGRGCTLRRFRALADLGAADLALARLAEGHLDALAILDEAGMAAGPGAYGVWAARGAGRDVRATLDASGWTLTGSKAFCSGAGVLDRALVTATAPDGPRLFDVDLADPGLRVLYDTWPAVGMSRSLSLAVELAGVAVAPTGAVGPPGFYTERVGFWWGSIGVAACWWGGTRGLVDAATSALAASPGDAGPVSASPGDAELAELGSAAACERGIARMLEWGASVVDAGRDVDAARLAALYVRDVVHAGATRILAAVAAAAGARSVCLDGEQSRRAADLYAYLSQHHPGRDAAAIGRSLLDARRAG